MSSTSNFFNADLPATLFPLKTNFFVVQKHEQEVSEYIYQNILNNDFPQDSFLPQQRVYATKPNGHLRRTVKLDPVAEYFLYDITYRNRRIFRPEVEPTRKSFGYRFKDGEHIHVHKAYDDYKDSLIYNDSRFKHKIQFDIASYFNCLYHHDISHWFTSKLGVSEVDSDALGKFFREINAGRSVDFLPQGIYPSKMIGNEFLKVVDLYKQLKSSCTIRFMDDFTFFDDNEDILLQDFIRVQQLLGQFGLNINPSKTCFDKNLKDVEKKLSSLHKSLGKIVEKIDKVRGISDVEFLSISSEMSTNLNAEQVSALLDLLKDESIDESDVESILGFLKSHSDSILEHFPNLLRRFPNLSKQIYSICSTISDKSELAVVLLEYLKKENFFLEYQLFWLASIVEDNLLGSGCYGDILMRLYDLTYNFKIARAKVLEVPEQNFGFKEIRSDYLKTGQSDWLSWASAMGTRYLKAGERNYVLDYFSKGSPMNYIIAGCVKKF